MTGVTQWRIAPDGDFSRLEKVLRRAGTLDRVPFFELFSNIEAEVLAALGERAGGRQPFDELSDEHATLRQHIEYMWRLGYDYVNINGSGCDFPLKERPSAKTNEGDRGYVQAASHTIATREDFEKYPWPKVGAVDCHLLELAPGFLPEGLKAISGHTGILENVMWLLGYEPISYLLYDDPGFVADMFAAVAAPIVAYYDAVAAHDIVGAIVMGEDMGHKTQTMLAPAVYREYLFPWHKKVVEMAHRHGKPAIIHSCGNLHEIMDDIIACGWDAKHSFEDNILPVWEAKAKYGDRIALLGGFDMDKISRLSSGEVRRHTRTMIDKCAPGGGWALGTGNSVANYVPVENLIAMLDEGFSIMR